MAEPTWRLKADPSNSNSSGNKSYGRMQTLWFNTSHMAITRTRKCTFYSPGLWDKSKHFARCSFYTRAAVPHVLLFYSLLPPFFCLCNKIRSFQHLLCPTFLACVCWRITSDPFNPTTKNCPIAKTTDIMALKSQASADSMITTCP